MNLTLKGLSDPVNTVSSIIATKIPINKLKVTIYYEREESKKAFEQSEEIQALNFKIVDVKTKFRIDMGGLFSDSDY